MQEYQRSSRTLTPSRDSPLQITRPFSAMSLMLLSQRMKAELDAYRHGRPCDDRYCSEVFYRAIIHQDHRAWEIWQQHFSSVVFSWIYQHPRRDSALRLDTPENYVALTFARTWLSARKKQLALTTYAATLSYLRASLNSTILDALRTSLRSTTLSLSDQEDEMMTEDVYHEHDVWAIIEAALPTERERRVAYLLYHCGLKAREIVHYCPNEFRDVKEIYRMRRKILERLARNAESIRWKLCEFELC